MNRRTFLGSAAALPCLSDPFSASAAEHADRDEFGGWTGLRFESSGFFRLEKNKGKWWFVTPKGNAFLALGMNHLHPGWLAQPYNKAFWNKEFGAKKAYDDTWRKGVFKKVMNEMELLGFNHFGVHNDQRMTIPSSTRSFTGSALSTSHTPRSPRKKSSWMSSTSPSKNTAMIWPAKSVFRSTKTGS